VKNINDRQEQVDQLLATVFSKRSKFAGTATSNSADPTDAEIIERANRAKNGDKFRALWSGSTTGYTSQSESELALLSILAWWTNNDRERMDRLFRQSGLYRDKWEREDYRNWTLDKALKGKGPGYTPGPRPSANGHSGGAGNGNEGTAAAKTQGSPLRGTSYRIILEYFKSHYDPTFCRGQAVYSAALGREVKMGEACGAAPYAVIEQLCNADDSPKDQQGNPAPNRLPQHFRTWAPVAWTDLKNSLQQEEQTAEIVEPARESFRAQIAEALHTLVAFGRRHDDGRGHEATDTERRTLLDWCVLWAKSGPYKKVRSYWCWTCKEGTGKETVLRVALRKELFGQLHHGAELAKISATKFSRLCGLYGIGTPGKACGGRVIELSQEFIAELRTDVNGQDQPSRRAFDPDNPFDPERDIDMQSNILLYLSLEGEHDSRDVAANVNLDEQIALAFLRVLVRDGKVKERVKDTSVGPIKFYSLSKDGQMDGEKETHAGARENACPNGQNGAT
jgi:hypothetical protein